MKRFISCLLTIALLLTLAMPVAMAADERTSGAFTYRIKGNGTLAITGFDWVSNSGDIYVPNMLDGYTISEIGAEAFARNTYNDNETKDKVVVTLPNTITTIGEKAFFNTAITSIIIPASVEEIGAGAFANCKNITRFSVASGNSTYTTIDDVLYNKKTKTLVSWPLPKKLTDIPNGIVAIGDYAFYRKEFGYTVNNVKVCLEFAKHFPASIKRIGNYAFAFAKMFLSSADDGYGFDLLLPEKVEIIGDYAFYSCYMYAAQTPFSFPESVKVIGDHAFENVRLNDGNFRVGMIEIKSDNLEIGDYAFAGADVDFLWNWHDGIETKAKVGEYAFTDLPLSFRLREEIITSFDTGAFKNVAIYSKEENNACLLVVPGKYEVVPAEAFREGGSAISVDKIILSDGITNVEAYAFADRKDLKEIELPSTLTIIEEGAFSNCPSLEEATLPASITQIGENAFDRETISLTVEAGSYAERWARDNGYAYGYAESDDLSWLNN